MYSKTLAKNAAFLWSSWVFTQNVRAASILSAQCFSGVTKTAVQQHPEHKALPSLNHISQTKARLRLVNSGNCHWMSLLLNESGFATNKKCDLLSLFFVTVVLASMWTVSFKSRSRVSKTAEMKSRAFLKKNWCKRVSHPDEMVWCKIVKKLFESSMWACSLNVYLYATHADHSKKSI